MSNRTILWSAAVIAVLGTGFALGLRFKQDPAMPPLPIERLKVVEVPASDMKKDYENFKLKQKVKSLQSRIAAVKVEPSPDSEVDVLPPPVQFPKDSDASFTPEGFQEVLAKTIEKCGMGLEVATVDCSEYPCIAWTKATDRDVHQFSMTKCAPWKEAFPEGELVIGKSVTTPLGAEERYFAWMPIPPDNATRPAVMKRVKERRKLTEQKLGLVD
jgi:hypothetical protein